nr:lecithin retinol acyltransferase family protein [uncultured Deefgea sp.]
MEKGDHLISARTGYSHHGIYIGHDQVIHYSGSSFGEFQSGTIEIVDLETFCQGNGFTIQAYRFRFYCREESIERAQSRLGEDWYNVLLNNCEHFVTWCIQGIHHSNQITELIHAAALTKAVLQLSLYSPVTIAKSITAKSVLPAALASSLNVSTGAGIATVALASGAAGLAAPALGCIAAGAVIGFGVQRLASWFSDY